jgi:hypothetical protein
MRTLSGVVAREAAKGEKELEKKIERNIIFINLSSGCEGAEDIVAAKKGGRKLLFKGFLASGIS